MALTKVTGSVIKDSVSLSGNVSVGGTLTYQDVTNVDALGIGTFRTGIKVLAGQVDVGSNIKIGNAGVITATSFVGSGANLTGITTTTINNNGSNRIITGSSTANTLEGESTFTYNGTHIAKIDTNQTYAMLQLDGNAGGAIEFYENGTRRFEIYGTDPEVALYDRDKGAYHTRFKAGGNVEISDGKLLIGTTAASTLASADDLTISTSGSTGITLFSATGNAGNIAFGDGTSGDDRQRGLLQYHHSDNTMRFFTNALRRVTIDSSGRFLKGLTSAGGSRSSTSVRYPHFQLSSPWSSGLGSYKIECTDDYPIIFLDSNASYANGTGAGTVTWSVKDGSGDYCNTASVRSLIDGTPSNDNAPGRLEFMTTTSGTSPTTKMTIDSGGSVLKPLNPAFYANNLSNNAVYSAGTIIPWPNTNVDTRNAFATSGSDIGRYTIPTTGIYFFGWRLNRLGDSRFDLAIYVNGSIKYYDELRSDAGSGIWQAESGHYIFNCTAGQKIDLRIASITNAGSGQFDGGQLYDGFFGWMIG